MTDDSVPALAGLPSSPPRELKVLLDAVPRYAFDEQGRIYGPVDAGEGTFVRHEDLAALADTL